MSSGPDPTPASIWWIIALWGWLGMNPSHQAQLPTHSFPVSLLPYGDGHHTVSSRDPQPANNTNACNWQRVRKEQQHQCPFLKSPKKLRSSWQHWSICLAPSSHASCGCISRICCHTGRKEGNWDGNTSEHQNYFCLSNICLYIKGGIFLFVSFLVVFFFLQYKDKFDQFGQVLKQATKRPWKMVDTYWQYV